MEPIALIGYRGVGKTTLGSWLAAQLGCRFIDTDEQVLVHVGYSSVHEVWERAGEEVWRAAESTIIPLLLTEPAVIALGGGAPMLPSVQASLNATKHVLYLNADQTTIANRLSLSGDRPALPQPDVELIEHRMPTYAALATATIDVSGSIDDSQGALSGFLSDHGMA